MPKYKAIVVKGKQAKDGRTYIHEDEIDGYKIQYWVNEEGGNIWFHLIYGDQIMMSTADGNGWPSLPRAKKSCRSVISAMNKFTLLYKVSF